MKRWIFLILAIIIISIFSIIKSCQRDKREVINIYTDREIENFIGKLAKKYENIDNTYGIYRRYRTVHTAHTKAKGHVPKF